jgi:iron-sulfur cluster assembly protein
MLAYANNLLIFGGRKMALELSKAAAHQVRQILEERGHGLGIRLIVDTSTCSGMGYRLVFVDEADHQDPFFENHGARVYVDAHTLAYVDGTQIDFATEDGESGFVINNPNVRSQCGCGQNTCA